MTDETNCLGCICRLHEWKTSVLREICVDSQAAGGGKQVESVGEHESVNTVNLLLRHTR